MPAVINNSVVKLKGMRGAKKTEKLHKTHAEFFRSYLWMSRYWRRTVPRLSCVQFFSHFLFWLFSKGLYRSNWSQS